MRTYVFKRESNNFDDILKDKNIKKYIVEQYRFTEHLILRVQDTPEALAYLLLMFGEEIVRMKDIIPDRTPVMDVDYVPKGRKWLT